MCILYIPKEVHINEVTLPPFLSVNNVDIDIDDDMDTISRSSYTDDECDSDCDCDYIDRDRFYGWCQSYRETLILLPHEGWIIISYDDNIDDDDDDETMYYGPYYGAIELPYISLFMRETTPNLRNFYEVLSIKHDKSCKLFVEVRCSSMLNDDEKMQLTDNLSNSLKKICSEMFGCILTDSQLVLLDGCHKTTMFRMVVDDYHVESVTMLRQIFNSVRVREIFQEHSIDKMVAFENYDPLDETWMLMPGCCRYGEWEYLEIIDGSPYESALIQHVYMRSQLLRLKDPDL
jgi:hypothetical protein